MDPWVLSASEWQLWTSDSRAVIPNGSTLGPRERASVRIRKQRDRFGGCSGVLIDDTHVLTAAHCVNGLLPFNFTVALGDEAYAGTAGQVRSVSAIHLDGSWNGKVRTDFAILEIPSPFSASYDTMVLADWSNDDIENSRASSIGYPAYTGGSACINNPGWIFKESDGVILDATTHISGRGIVKTRLDATERQSGSPMYACPGGTGPECTGSETAYVFGIMTKIATGNDLRGPKVPGYLRDWALGII